MKLGKIRKALEGLLLDVNLGRVTTDKAILTWDSDEDLKSGDFVRGIDEDGNEYNLEDGDYVTDDGKTIVVEGNKVVEIKDKEAEVSNETPTNEEFARTTIQNFEVSYSEKEQLIAAAYRELGGNGYLAEAGDDYAVFYFYNGDWEPAGYMRYDIEWVDGKPVLSNPVEVKPSYVPKTDVANDVVEETKETEVTEVKEVTEEMAGVQEMARLQETDGESPVEPDVEPDEDQPEPASTEETVEDKVAKLEDLVAKLEAQIGELENRIAKLEDRIGKLEETPKTVEEEFRSMSRPKGNGRKENNIIRFAEA